MEVAIGEHGTDMDMLAEAAETKSKLMDSTTSKTGKTKVCDYRF